MPIKFSLQAIFAVVTLSCFAALNYQQYSVNAGLAKEIEELKTDIAEHAPWIEEGVPLLKRLTAKAAAATEVSITHLPVLGDLGENKFLIFVPGDQPCSLVIETNEEDPLVPVFNPNKPLELDLPAGLSTLVVTQNMKTYFFALNGNHVYSTDCTTTGFVFPRTSFLTGRVEPISKDNPVIFSATLVDIRDLSDRGGTSMKCRLKQKRSKATEDKSSKLSHEAGGRK